MKVNFNVPIKLLTGKQMQESGLRKLEPGEQQVEGKQYREHEGEPHEVVTIDLFARHFVVHALSQDYDFERDSIDDKEKHARYKLLTQINESKDLPEDQQKVSVDSEQIQTIRKLISKLYNPQVTGQIIDILEGE